MTQARHRDDTPTTPNPRSEADHRLVADFLFREALLLDQGKFREWLLLLSPQISYVLTAPSIAMVRPGKRPAPSVILMKENMGSLEARVKQLVTPSLTLADNPRPFVRRFISNILVDRESDTGQLSVSSYALVHRARGAQDGTHVFSTGRQDLFVETDDGIKLLRREAQLDEPVIAARNISALF